MEGAVLSLSFRPNLLGAGIVLGVLARLFFALAPGNSIAAPWSGVSDAPAYVLLAHNVASGKGLTYCGMADAIRPPLYPLILSLLITVFRSSFAIAARVLQLAAGFLTAFLCYVIARRIWREELAVLAGVAALFVPTLVYLTGELMTETSATLVVAGFLYVLLAQSDKYRLRGWVAIGMLVGVATLIRFNLAVLGIVAVCVVWKIYSPGLALRAALVTTLAAGLTIAPWVVRNALQFHGQVLLSSQTGYNMVQGLLAPQGRALPGDRERLIRAEGWEQAQIETNNPTRLAYPDEGDLNANTTKVAARIWRTAGISALTVVLRKLSYFWLETDQLTWYPGRGHWVRMAGVFVWWLMLGCAVAGWFLVRKENNPLAPFVLFYASIVTIFHVPFVMNTRLGTPLLAPLACILLPGGFKQWTTLAPPSGQAGEAVGGVDGSSIE